MPPGPTPTAPVADEAALAAGRLLFAQECRFVTAAASLNSLPPAGLTEVAFAGRSNVGKSSLINGLTGRKSLARSSNTPGRTRQINFFSLADRLLLVDLPTDHKMTPIFQYMILSLSNVLFQMNPIFQYMI